MAYHISGASLRRYVLFWLCAFVAFVIFLLAFRTILLPTGWSGEASAD